MSGLSRSEVFEDADELKSRPLNVENSASEANQNQGKPQKSSHTSTLPHTATVLPSDAALSVARQRLSAEISLPGGQLPSFSATTVVIYNSPQAKDKEDAEDVTEEFIKEFNNHRGNADNLAKAYRMLINTRSLAGLDPLSSSHIDIPSARRNFFLLAGLDHHKLKMSALDNLIEILQKDEIKHDTAFDLVVLAINLMKQMDRELLQTQLVDEQIKICQAYGIVAELVQRHYAKEHLGGITFELKSQLIKTARTLEDLNTHGDARLHFAVEFALEGVKRLRDDRKELFELGERLFHLVVAAASAYAYDMQNFSAELEKVYSGLDVRITNAWYDATLLNNELAKKSDKDMAQLAIMQGMVKEKGNDLDWKFLYNAIEKFGEIAIKGSTHQIRKAAINGQKILNVEYPGIIDFIAFKEFYRKPSFKPLIHFKKPVIKDNNVVIRQLCVSTLIKICTQSPDKSVRKKAKTALLSRLGREEDQVILQAIKNAVPEKLSDRKEWLNETGAYVFKPVERETLIPAKKEPAEPVQKIATQVFASLPLTWNPSLIQSPQTTSFDQQVILRGNQSVKDFKPMPIIVSETSTPETSPVNTPPASPRLEIKGRRTPNKVAFLLGKCLSLDPQVVQSQIVFTSDIHPHGDHELHINVDGMKMILRLIEKNKAIKTLNFTKSEIDKDALVLLTEALTKLDIHSIHLPAGLSHTAAKKLVDAFENNFELEINLDSSKDYLLFGAALVKKGLVTDAIQFYFKSLSGLGEESEAIPLKAKIFYKIGQAEVINGSLLEAEHAYLQSVKLRPESFRANYELAKVYRDRKNLAEALKYADIALKMKPDDQKAGEIAAFCRKAK